MIRLGIFFGGRSGEHEVSLMSATSVINAVNKDRFQVVPIGITREGKWFFYDGPVEKIEDGSWQGEPEMTVVAGLGSLKERIDFALPILHGPYGEDGTIQGLFEMLDLPYGGCGVTGSALAMDKILAKTVFAQGNLPQGPYVPVIRDELEQQQEVVLEKIERTLSYPMFVKPANMGSSVGISKVKDSSGIKDALKEAAKHDRRILVEEGINCRELETAILGNFDAKASGVGEIVPSAEFYNYQAKYFDGGQSKLCIPADISDEIAEEIRSIALSAYQLLDCSGFARVDFFLEKETNKVYINEINTIPGFTRFSMFPLLWEQAGLAYPKLIERIVMLGYERYNAKNNR
ncbi:MAG: D-alanine--D-alanine ligase [Eubacteriales bacterium]|nr:D-alanine--D-alanine ligase [Eubacteriales bacterium]MDD4583124.1 D-alanine--D-alanine ligase [Eubacteriales bacterium]